MQIIIYEKFNVNRAYLGILLALSLSKRLLIAILFVYWASRYTMYAGNSAFMWMVHLSQLSLDIDTKTKTKCHYSKKKCWRQVPSNEYKLAWIIEDSLWQQLAHLNETDILYVSEKNPFAFMIVIFSVRSMQLIRFICLSTKRAKRKTNFTSFAIQYYWEAIKWMQWNIIPQLVYTIERQDNNHHSSSEFKSCLLRIYYDKVLRWSWSIMILVVLLLTVFWVFYLWKRRSLLCLAGKLKGLNGYPFIGSAYKFFDANSKWSRFTHWRKSITVFNKWPFLEILDVINEFHRDFGGPGKFWLGNRLFVYVDDPVDIETILNSPHSLNKGESYDFISESIGLGLITLKCKILLHFELYYLEYVDLLILLLLFSAQLMNGDSTGKI